jgi:hypothetical protein
MGRDGPLIAACQRHLIPLLKLRGAAPPPSLLQSERTGSVSVTGRASLTHAAAICGRKPQEFMLLLHVPPSLTADPELLLTEFLAR